MASSTTTSGSKILRCTLHAHDTSIAFSTGRVVALIHILGRPGSGYLVRLFVSFLDLSHQTTKVYDYTDYTVIQNNVSIQIRAVGIASRVWCKAFECTRFLVQAGEAW